MMGRPAADINWPEVDKLLKAGCDGTHVAAHFGVHPETLYRRCEKDNNIGFSEYCQEKKSAGNALLIAAQFNKAIKGDSGMLKWLGIHRLNQKETTINDIEEASKRGAIDAVREIQAESRARIGSSSRSIVETEQPLLDQRCAGEPSEVPNELGADGIT